MFRKIIVYLEDSSGIKQKESGYKIESEGCLKTELFKAVRKNRTKTLESLMQQGADVNAKDKDGKTALILASENGYEEIVALLLEHPKIEVKTRDREGKTALELARANKHKLIGVLLVVHEKVIHKKDINVGLSEIRNIVSIIIDENRGNNDSFLRSLFVEEDKYGNKSYTTGIIHWTLIILGTLGAIFLD